MNAGEFRINAAGSLVHLSEEQIAQLYEVICIERAKRLVGKEKHGELRGRKVEMSAEVLVTDLGSHIVKSRWCGKGVEYTLVEHEAPIKEKPTEQKIYGYTSHRRRNIGAK